MHLMTLEEWDAYCAQIDAVNHRIVNATGLSPAPAIPNHIKVIWEIEKTEPIWFEKCQGAEGPCDSEHAYRRRQNTAYVDGNNFAVYCDSCQEIANAYWKERWDEYYSGCM